MSLATNLETNLELSKPGYQTKFRNIAFFPTVIEKIRVFYTVIKVWWTRDIGRHNFLKRTVFPLEQIQ